MVGEEKSTAQNYTKKYPHIAFMTIEDYEGGGKLLGDVDGDGEIKIADATLLQQYLVKMEVENFNIINSNIITYRL